MGPVELSLTEKNQLKKYNNELLDLLLRFFDQQMLINKNIM